MAFRCCFTRINCKYILNLPVRIGCAGWCVAKQIENRFHVKFVTDKFIIVVYLSECSGRLYVLWFCFFLLYL